MRGDSFRGQPVPRNTLTAMRKTFRAAGLRKVDLPLDESIYEVWAKPRP